MEVPLDRLWDGRPAPAGAGGVARLVAGPDRVGLAWDLGLLGPPSLPVAAPGFLDGLWSYDVVELFLAPADPQRTGYLELEVGPAGHWLALAFCRVRERAAELRAAKPRIRTEVSAARWRGELGFDLAGLEGLLGAPPWRGLVTAVLGAGGARLHLAWPPLPGEAPDFHQPGAFAALGPGS